MPVSGGPPPGTAPPVRSSPLDSHPVMDLDDSWAGSVASSRGQSPAGSRGMTSGLASMHASGLVPLPYTPDRSSLRSSVHTSIHSRAMTPDRAFRRLPSLDPPSPGPGPSPGPSRSEAPAPEASRLSQTLPPPVPVARTVSKGSVMSPSVVSSSLLSSAVVQRTPPPAPAAPALQQRPGGSPERPQVVKSSSAGVGRRFGGLGGLGGSNDWFLASAAAGPGGGSPGSPPRPPILKSASDVSPSVAPGRPKLPSMLAGGGREPSVAPIPEEELPPPAAPLRAQAGPLGRPPPQIAFEPTRSTRRQFLWEESEDLAGAGGVPHLPPPSRSPPSRLAGPAAASPEHLPGPPWARDPALATSRVAPALPPAQRSPAQGSPGPKLPLGAGGRLPLPGAGAPPAGGRSTLAGAFPSARRFSAFDGPDPVPAVSHAGRARSRTQLFLPGARPPEHHSSRDGDLNADLRDF